MDSALSIAELLKPLRAEMIVRRNCHSSCANYFLPVARRIVVEPDAWVILHGSIDQHQLTKMMALGRTRALYDRQMQFAADNDIPLGWLLFRTEAEFQAGMDGRHLTGTTQTWASDGDAKIAFEVVEESFMRDCLPHVEIAPFVGTRVQRLYTDARYRERWAHRHTYPTGSLSCVDDSFVSPDPDPALIRPTR